MTTQQYAELKRVLLLTDAQKERLKALREEDERFRIQWEARISQQ